MDGIHYHIGDESSRAIAKLALNIFLNIQPAALAEILEMAQRGDIAPRATANLIIGMPACSPLAKRPAEPLAVLNVAPLFPFNLMKKDPGYTWAAARVKRIS